MALRIVAASLLAIVVAGIAPGTSDAAVQRTIVRTPRPLVSMDSDGRWVAWRVTVPVGVARVPCNAVRLLRIGASRVQHITRCTGAEWGTRASVDAGTVFWNRRLIGGQSCCDTIVDDRLGGAPGRPRWFAEADRTIECGGVSLGSQAARGGVFAFARATWSITGPMPDEGCGHTQPGDTISGGSVALLSGPARAPGPLAGSPASVFVAVDHGRVALVPYALHPGLSGEPPAAANVQIWTIGSAAPPVSVALSAPPTALALTRSVVAAVVDGRVERYDAVTGAWLGPSAALPGATLLVAARGGTIVYAGSRTIAAMNAATGAGHVVAFTRRRPGAIAVGAGRVLWSITSARGSSIHVARLG
jgi:hypothetical protein